MNKAITIRLTRLERQMVSTRMNVIVVHGTDRAMWPKPEPGAAFIYVPAKKDVPPADERETSGLSRTVA
jgi:hypothetical protein